MLDCCVHRFESVFLYIYSRGSNNWSKSGADGTGSLIYSCCKSRLGFAVIASSASPFDARFAAPTVEASPVPTGSSVQTPKPAKATSKAVVASNRETLGKRTAQQAWSAALKRRSVDADVLPATFPKGPIPGSSVELKHAISEFSRNGHTNGLGGNFTVSMLRPRKDQAGEVVKRDFECTCNAAKDQPDCGWGCSYEQTTDGGWVLCRYKAEK